MFKKRTKAEKLKQFCEIYGSRTGRFHMTSDINATRRLMYFHPRMEGKTTCRNYLVQAHKAKTLMMNMNYAEIELAIMASYMKCHNDCPFIKMIFPPLKRTGE